MKPIDSSPIFDQVRQPVEVARGLPSELYTETDWLENEFRQLFGVHWIPAALSDDVPETGDIYPVSVAGQALIVVRDENSRVRVFHNVCRHRGTRLVDTPCRGRNLLVCPYHAWSYTLAGKLISTPHFAGIGHHSHEQLAPGAEDLVEVRSAVWNHIVFVNPDGAAAPLSDHTRTIDERWSDYDLADVYLGGSDAFEIKANWKLVLENYVESYHLPTVHKGLTDYSPLADHELVVADHVVGQVSHHYRPEDAGAELPRFKRLPASRVEQAEYLLLFPNLMVSVTPDHYRVTLVTPVSPDLTHQRWCYFFVGAESTEERFQFARDTVVARIGAVTEEDIPILEKMQKGRSSDGFDGGRFSAYHERTTHRFHQLVAESLSGERPTRITRR